MRQLGALLAAAILCGWIGCASEVSRDSLPSVLGSDVTYPELGESFWYRQQLDATDAWDYAESYCQSYPTKPNCAPVLNLLAIHRQTIHQPTHPEDS